MEQTVVRIRTLEIGSGMPKICVPVVGKTEKEILEGAERAKVAKPDLVEFRVDWYEEAADSKKVVALLEKLRKCLGELPVLFTFRSSREGGEAALSDGAYQSLNEAAIASGFVDCVDVELFSGDAVVKGGRYDHLIEKFGKKSPSIGFAIVIDELVSALTRQKIRIVYPRKNTIIIYAEGRQLEAIRLAKDFRRKAKNAELLKKDENSGLEDYIRYGNDYYAGSLVYIEETGEVTMVNLVTGEQKIVNSTDRS